LLGQDLQSSDSLTGPWIDLAQSVGSATFSIVTPGAAVTERIIGDTREITVTDLYTTTDPAHPTRFVRLSVTSL
jgi:hypothetical protein